MVRGTGFERFQSLGNGLAYVPDVSDQIIAGLVTCSGGSALILPGFNNPSAIDFFNAALLSLMSVPQPWQTGIVTLGSEMDLELAKYLANPIVMDLGYFLRRRHPISRDVYNEMINGGWEQVNPDLLKGVIPAPGERTQVVYVGLDNPDLVVAMSPVCEAPNAEIPRWATYAAIDPYLWETVGDLLWLKHEVPGGEHFSSGDMWQLVLALAAFADEFESQLGLSD